jgi:hypothetical protein
MQNTGNHFESWNVGVLGPVTLSGLNEGRRDLSHQKWTYQVLLLSSKFEHPPREKQTETFLLLFSVSSITLH